MESDKDFRFIQKEPSKDGSFDICYVYAMFIRFNDTRNKKPCRLKYIARAEKIDEVCAIKFYASRDRKSIHNKYSLAHGQMSPSAVLRIFGYCIEIIKDIMQRHPECSFVIKASEAYDPHTQKWENEAENQRFRIYRSYLSKNIGTSMFSHFHFPENSIYLLVRKDCRETDITKKDRIMGYMKTRFSLD